MPSLQLEVAPRTHAFRKRQSATNQPNDLRRTNLRWTEFTNVKDYPGFSCEVVEVRLVNKFIPCGMTSFVRGALPILLVLFLGCSKMEMANWKKQTDADSVRIVGRYKQAGVRDVEAVLNDYLGLADGYERRGWGRFGAPGWIDELRSNCEARLAVFYKATGKEDAYRSHVNRAIAFRTRAHPNTSCTADEVCGFVERLDALNIKPMWREEVGGNRRH